MMQLAYASAIGNSAGPKRLAIITTHPIQYYAPWFRHLAGDGELSVRVFYLWDFGVTRQVDAGFQKAIQWDVPLLSEYEYEFVPNVSAEPGTQRFRGLQNPQLAERVAAFAPDAVLMMGYNYASLYRFLWQWRSGKAPLIFRGDSHRLVARSGGKEWLRRRFLTKLFSRFSACLYVGDANREYFRYHGVPDARLFFAPHAVDNEWFISQRELAHEQAAAWKEELGIPPSDAVILFAGKFEAKKRPLDLMQAFLEAGLERAALLFVGDGALGGEMRARAKGRKDIFFAPFQNQSLMPRVYAAADVVALPSFGTSETWGLAINEAMCMSRPIIVSTHVGCASDLVRHGRNGLVFPAGDVAALAGCLTESLSDRPRLRQWGDESLAIIQKYSYTQATLGLKQAMAHLHVLQSPSLAGTMPSR